MNLKPLGDRLIVERIELEELSASGIMLPEPTREKPGSPLHNGGQSKPEPIAGPPTPNLDFVTPPD